VLVSGGLIGLAGCPRSLGIVVPRAFFRPPGITSTQSTAQNYSGTHPLPRSNRRNKYKMSQHHSSDNIKSFDTTSFNYRRDDPVFPDERSEILAWLSPLEPQIRHQDIRAGRVDEVGDWLFQTEEYRNWFGGIRWGESDGAALFCYGGLGVGKTYIR